MILFSFKYLPFSTLFHTFLKIMVRSQLTDFEKGQIYELVNSGCTLREVGEKFHRSPQTILSVVNNIKENGKPVRKKQSGRKRCTSRQCDNNILKLREENWNVTAEFIKKTLNLKIHSNTIRNRLNENHFKSYWSTKKPYINEINMKKRVAWAKAHLKWGKRKWMSVLFTDETSFRLSCDYPIRVWRKRNERYNVKSLRATRKFDKKLFVYASFCAKGVGLMAKIDGRMDQILYQKILNEYMLPSAENLFQNLSNKWILMQDNDSKHCAKSTLEWFELNGVQVMDWPPQSPDLNPIENLWSIVKNNLKDKHPKDLDELYELAQKEWMSIPIKCTKNLVQSMKKRCQMVIESGGAPINY